MKRMVQVSKVVLLSVIVAAFATTVVQGKPEYSKKEKTSCVTCHVKPGSKDLNDVGKCYGQKKALDGCKAEPKK